jgi:hypothetical protein
MHWLTENVVMEFLPPGDEEGVSYCCWCEKPGIKSWAAFILKTLLACILSLISSLDLRNS